MIVGVELVTRDRESFDWWWPQHLTEVLECVDRLCVRADPAKFDEIEKVLREADTVDDRRVELVPQFTEYGRWQEDAERDALLAWALEMGQDGNRAEWCVCFDADEVIEPGGGRALRRFLGSPAVDDRRVVGVYLTYSSHHRIGWVLPTVDTPTWRAFRLDEQARSYSYKSDEDGLHCGSVPWAHMANITVPDLRVVHYHALTCEEYMAERAFYDNTGEVTRNGGIDWLYRCDRFGDEHQAVPLADALLSRDERLARVAAGEVAFAC